MSKSSIRPSLARLVVPGKLVQILKLSTFSQSKLLCNGVQFWVVIFSEAVCIAFQRRKGQGMMMHDDAEGRKS